MKPGEASEVAYALAKDLMDARDKMAAAGSPARYVVSAPSHETWGRTVATALKLEFKVHPHAPLGSVFLMADVPEFAPPAPEQP